MTTTNPIEGLGEAGEAAAIFVAIDVPQPLPGNANLITDAEVEELAGAMRAFGFGRPILCWKPEHPLILAGHKAYRAAQRLGLAVVPVRWQPHLSEASARAAALADNQLGRKAKWSPEMLRREAKGAAAAGFSLQALGFSSQKAEKLLAEAQRPRVVEIPVSPVRAEFWLSIRGPLPTQPEVIERLKAALGEIPGVQVQVGVIQR